MSESENVRIHFLSNPENVRIGKRQNLKTSDIFRFWKILTFSDSDVFRFWRILTFSDSDLFRFWRILTFSDSDKFRFWRFLILTFSGFDKKWILTFSDSDMFMFLEWPPPKHSKGMSLIRKPCYLCSVKQVTMAIFKVRHDNLTDQRKNPWMG